MILRPVAENGDILPVLSRKEMLSGPAATARLAEYRLTTYTGEWWENPEKGFPLLARMQEGRLPAGDPDALGNLITAYIRETPGVREVEDVRFSVSGRQFTYSCLVRTEEGTESLRYEAQL